MGREKPVALIDLDGTLADYDSVMDRDLKAILSYEDYKSWRTEQSNPRIKAAIKLIRNQPGWWVNLPCLEDGFHLLDLLRGYNFSLNILTKGPYNHANSWSEKVTWCRKNVGSDVSITITEDKSLVYGKVLCDDWVPYITSWLEFRPRGLVIMPDRPWNQDFKHDQVIRYFNSKDRVNIFEVSAALEALTKWDTGVEAH